MADITLTIPDPVVPRVRAALAQINDVDVGDITVADVKDYLRTQLQQLVNSVDRQSYQEAFTPDDLGTS